MQTKEKAGANENQSKLRLVECETTAMKHLKVAKPDLDFLMQQVPRSDILENLAIAKDSGFILTKGKYNTHAYSLSLSPEQIEFIHDRLFDIFLERGLEPDSEPNSFGIWIESLLDVFNPYEY